MLQVGATLLVCRRNELVALDLIVGAVMAMCVCCSAAQPAWV